MVNYESSRAWGLRFGRPFADALKHHLQLRRLTADQRRAARDGAVRAWREITGVAAAGDWTRRLAKRVAAGDVPKRMWVSRVKPPGFMHSIKAYRRSLVIATCAGIAPVLPYIVNGQTQIFVTWLVQNPDRTFSEVASLARRHLVMYTWDTGRRVRPDLARLAVEAARAFGADAVFCVSNPAGTKTVLAACLAEEVPGLVAPRPMALAGTQS